MTVSDYTITMLKKCEESGLKDHIQIDWDTERVYKKTKIEHTFHEDMCVLLLNYYQKIGIEVTYEIKDGELYTNFPFVELVDPTQITQDALFVHTSSVITSELSKEHSNILLQRVRNLPSVSDVVVWSDDTNYLNYFTHNNEVLLLDLADMYFIAYDKEHNSLDLMNMDTKADVSFLCPYTRTKMLNEITTQQRNTSPNTYVYRSNEAN